MPSDIIPWGDKARSLIAFWVEAHNSTWKSDDGLVRAGGHLGGALVLSFAVECAIKALLEMEGKPITKKLWIHHLHKLFHKLSPETRNKASNVYQSLLKAERDIRVHIPPVNSLSACLKTHDDSFVEWRYSIGAATKFFPVPVAYACVSLLTLVYPDQKIVIGSSTSLETELAGGKVVGAV